jgi:hypothetical protein
VRDSGAMRTALRDDRGSVTPLILGFFLIGLLVVAGAVLASDAFGKHRDLQSTCDGAAIAAANAVDAAVARTATLGTSLPLAAVQQATDGYLARDPDRAAVQIRASLSAYGRTVLVDCQQQVKIAFGALLGRGDGITEHATASARGLLS